MGTFSVRWDAEGDPPPLRHGTQGRTSQLMFMLMFMFMFMFMLMLMLMLMFMFVFVFDLNVLYF